MAPVAEKIRMRVAITFTLSILIALGYFAPANADVVVTTLAGSGSTGFADGPGSKASFMLPMGLAYDRSGNAYVADAAAQRIRMIQKNGTVRTIAGSGEPGSKRHLGARRLCRRPRSACAL